MGTEACNVCGGMCELPTGRYEDCYSCGGKGYGRNSEESCRVCAGSGKTSKEIYDLCWKCRGVGRTSTAHKAEAIPKKTKRKAEGTLGSKKSGEGRASEGLGSKVSDAIGGISIVVAVLVGIIFYKEQTEVGPALGMAFLAFLATGLILNVAYLMIKIAIEVLKFLFGMAVLGFIVILIANAIGFEWAERIISGL